MIGGKQEERNKMTNEQKKQLLLDLIKIEENGEIFNFTRAERAEFQKWVDGLIDQESQWIPVSEKLPEVNIYDRPGPVWKQEVLITGYLSFDDEKTFIITTAFAEDVRNKCVPDINVIAWMPLPNMAEREEER